MTYVSRSQWATECGPCFVCFMRARERRNENGGYSGYTTTKHLCRPYVSRDRGVATRLIFSGYTMATVATVATKRGCSHPIRGV